MTIARRSNPSASPAADRDLAYRLPRSNAGLTLIQDWSQWHALHALPVGADGEIDHLLIGPGGVFAVSTQHCPDASVWVLGDTFKVDGRQRPFVSTSRSTRQLAAARLSARALFDVEVTGVITVLGADPLTVLGQPGDGAVVVIEHPSLETHLRSLPAVLGRPSVERIYNVGRHLATWQPNAVEWSDEIGQHDPHRSE